MDGDAGARGPRARDGHLDSRGRANDPEAEAAERWLRTRIGTAGHDRCELASFERDRQVSHGIDPPVEAMQPTLPRSPANGRMCVADGPELTGRHHAVLASGERR